jgi:hypothetical protein
MKASATADAQLGAQQRGERIARWALVAGLAAGAVVLIWNSRGTTFYADEWRFYAQYRGISPHTLLEPINGHLLVLPILAYKLLLIVFGAGSFVPFRLFDVALQVLGAALFAKLLADRVGWVATLPATIVLLLLGAGWEVVAGAYASFNMLSIDAGLGMLLLLERRTLRADILAGVLLFVSLFSFGIGLSFAVGAAVQIFFRPAPQRWPRAWVVAVPLLLFVAWELWARGAYPPEASRLTASSIPSLPSNLAQNLAYVCAALTGLFRLPGDQPLAFDSTPGAPIAVVLAIAAGWVAVRRRRRLRPETWVYLVILLSYWVLLSLVVDPSPGLPRYLYPGGVFLLLFLGELAYGVRAGLRGFLVLAAIAAVALFSNITMLNQAGDFFRLQAAESRGELGVIDSVGGRVPAGFLIRPQSPTMPLHAGEYLDAAESYGTPAYSLSELPGASPVARGPADSVLIRALRLRLRAAGRSLSPRSAQPTGPDPARNFIGPARRCLRIDPNFTSFGVAGQGPADLYLKAAPGEPVDLVASRFSPAPASTIGQLDPGRAALLRLPRDGIGLPWHFEAIAGRLAFACRLPARG